MLVLLGSHALSNYISIQPGIDLDILGSYDEVTDLMKWYGKPSAMYPIDGGKKLVAKYPNKPIKVIEAEINWGHSSPKMLHDLVMNDRGSINTRLIDGETFPELLAVPSLHLLYTIKMSHRYLRNSPHFLKTMKHIHLMREHGARILPEYEEFLTVREKETYWYNHPKLNVDKADFFRDDGIQYVYDHDSIHDAMKHLEQPAYKYYTPNQVMSSRKAFESCDDRIKLYGVLEETYVLALERSQIPFKGTADPRKSFETALMKVCTSITSGFFREYAWENYKIIDAMYDETYVDKFWVKVEAGEVKKHEPNNKISSMGQRR